MGVVFQETKNCADSFFFMYGISFLWSIVSSTVNSAVYSFIVQYSVQCNGQYKYKHM